ncbi:hypothetical protein E5288_WYG000201 [Bos mutus]|uniref:Uncharacterized protein n=1 Tax=Bos mutus TaxID=72004 RepID=A0A6B0QUS3_9CETA|nr:hypothetical protein [Bos mutus]
MTTGNGWLKGVIIQLLDNRLAPEFRSLAMKCGRSPIGSCRKKVFKLERFDKMLEQYPLSGEHLQSHGKRVQSAHCVPVR